MKDMAKPYKAVVVIERENTNWHWVGFTIKEDDDSYLIQGTSAPPRMKIVPKSLTIPFSEYKMKTKENPNG